MDAPAFFKSAFISLCLLIGLSNVHIGLLFQECTSQTQKYSKKQIVFLKIGAKVVPIFVFHSYPN